MQQQAPVKESRESSNLPVPLVRQGAKRGFPRRIGHTSGRCHQPRKSHNPGCLFLLILVWSYCFIVVFRDGSTRSVWQRGCAMQESLNMQQNGTGGLVKTNGTN
jgi:hypothetical protein